LRLEKPIYIAPLAEAKSSPFARVPTAAQAFRRHFINQNKEKLFTFALAGPARRESSVTAPITAFKAGKQR
jgi:hypothetical protein